jgi:hypothetical protein
MYKRLLPLCVILSALLLLCVLRKQVDHGSKKEMVRKLTRQTARWATAARQDKNPLIAVLHANYAAGYLWALKDVASDAEIAQFAEDSTKFEEEVLKVQDMVTKRLARICPDFAPNPDMLAIIAAEGVKI